MKLEHVNNNERRVELLAMQRLPLVDKIALTQEYISKAAQHHELYVSFSGGVDSSVAVAITAATMKKLGFHKLYVLHIQNGMSYKSVSGFVEPFCELIARRYGVEVVLDVRKPSMGFSDVLTQYGYPVFSKEISSCVADARKGFYLKNGTYQRALTRLHGDLKDPYGNESCFNLSSYAFLLDAPFLISSKCCPCTKHEPIRAYERCTGRIPVIATMASESRLRFTSVLLHGLYNPDSIRPTVHPFSMWRKQDMLRFLLTEDLPVADAYGQIVPKDTVYTTSNGFTNILRWGSSCQYCTTGCQRTGCLFCLYGIMQDLGRITRLQNIDEEKERADYMLGGGQFDSNGMWIPNGDGLGYWYILDWLAKQGYEIPYDNPERYRRNLNL